MTATQAIPQTAPRLSKPLTILSWVIRAPLAAMFLMAAWAKLSGDPMLIESFNRIGLGQWFRYVTAVVEIVGVIALLIPNVTAFGALWLGTTMFFATLAHLLAIHTSPTLALALLAANAVLIWLHRGQLVRFLKD